MKIGVGLFSFNRPDYFKQQIQSIEKSEYLENYHFHLFQDGWVNHATQKVVARPQDILECISIFEKAQIPHKFNALSFDKTNWGIAINQYQGLDALCNSYEAVLLLEDDVVLSPYWFRLGKLLLEKYKDRKDVYSFSPGFKKEGTDLSALASRNLHHWCDIFWSERWLRIEPLFLQYYELVKDIDYRYRPHTDIMRFFEKVGNPQQGVTSQDSAKYWALTKKGMHRRYFTCNRALYIGKRGQHFVPSFYEKNKFGQQKPYIFDEDKELSEFKLI